MVPSILRAVALWILLAPLGFGGDVAVHGEGGHGRDRWTPLTLAILSLDPGDVRRQLASGADPNQGTAAGLLPLMAAVQDNQVKAVHDLLKAGADVNGMSFFWEDEILHGWQPIHAAADGRALGVNSVHSQDASWRMIETLLAHGADIDALTHRDGQTPLFLAAKGGRASVVNRLLQAGASPRLRDRYGASPLFYAARSGSLPTVQALLAAGLSVGDAGPFGGSLLHAANGRNAEMVRFLLTAGLDVHATDENGLTPLHYHAGWGDPGSVRLLLAAGADPQAMDREGLTPLHRAPGTPASAAVIQALLDAGVPVDVQNPKDGSTPLHRAAANGDAAAAALLINNGAAMDAIDHRGWTAFHHAAAHPGGGEVIPLLARHTINRIDGEEVVTPLILAIREENDAAAKALLQAGADPMARSFGGTTALHFAAGRNGAMVEELLRRQALVDAQDMAGKTPLQFASAKGHLANIRLLVQRGANLHLADGMGATPLHYAVQNEHVNAARLLLQLGAAVNQPDALGQTPLHHAAVLKRPDLTRALQEAGPDSQDMAQGDPPPAAPAGRGPPPFLSQQTQTMLAAISAGDADTVRKLLTQGVSAEIMTATGFTALDLALKEKRREIVTLLLDHGARPDQSENRTFLSLELAIDWQDTGIIDALLQHGANIEGHNATCAWTPLHYAAAQGNLETVRFLLDKGARTDAVSCQGNTVVHWTCAHETTDPEIFNLLLSRGLSLHQPNLLGQSPLDIAAQHGNLPAIAFLLDHGVTMMPPPGLMTPLHHAALAGHPDAVSLLLARGAPVDARAAYGFTPLHFALYSRSPQTVRRLLSLGADPQARDQHGRTPLALARAFGHDSLDTVQALTPPLSQP